MLYYSELKGKKVVVEKGMTLGRLTDLVFLASQQPLITKLVVDGGKNHRYTIPVSFIKKINSHITVSDAFGMESLAENEMYIGKNILDQQIIDIKGNKVVRVNDVAIQDKPVLLVAGVDIGIVGALRWFGMEETWGKLLRMMGRTIKSRFLSWGDIQPVELSRGKVMLRKEQTKLSQLMPEDLADHVENLSMRSATRILDLMDEALAAEVVENLNTSYQQSLFKTFIPSRCAKLITHMDPDEAVDILLALSTRKRETILEKVSPQKREELIRLLQLSYTPIGGLITSEYFTAAPEETAVNIRQRIRSNTANFSNLSYVYAVNKMNQLVGAINLHELLLQAGDVPLYKFMNPSLVVIHLTTPLEIAIKQMLKYELEALPVINDKKEMLGIVIFDDLTKEVLKKFQ